MTLEGATRPEFAGGGYDVHEKDRRRRDRERKAQKSIESQKIDVGNTVTVSRTTEDYSTKIVTGMFAGYYWHRTFRRGILVETEEKQEKIRLRGIVNILKKG